MDNRTLCRSKELLLYITHGFPYQAHDAFNKEELPFLLKNGRTIALFPRIGSRTHLLPALPSETVISDSLLPSKWAKLAHLLSLEAIPLVQSEIASCRRMGAPFNWQILFRAVGIALQTKHAIMDFLARFKCTNKPVVLYSYWFSEAIMGLCLVKKELPHCRVVARAHGSDLYPWLYPHGYLPFRHLRRQIVDKVYPCSSYGASVLFEDGYGRNQVHVSRLAVSEATQVSVSSPAEELSLISVSSLDTVKRLPLLVDSLAKLAQAKPGLTISWHHLGGGNRLHEFEQYVAGRLSQASNLSYFLHGQVSPEAVRDFLVSRPLDGLVNVSSSEGIPVSMMEAAAVGLPVLGTDVGGTREIVTPETGVLLNKHFSSEEFIRGAEQLAQWKRPEKRTQIVAFQRKHYAKDLSYPAFAQCLDAEMKLSEKILGERSI